MVEYLTLILHREVKFHCSSDVLRFYISFKQCLDKRTFTLSIVVSDCLICVFELPVQIKIE